MNLAGLNRRLHSVITSYECIKAQEYSPSVCPCGGSATNEAGRETEINGSGINSSSGQHYRVAS